MRHRQTKGAATDMFGLPPLRHTPTLPSAAEVTGWHERPHRVAQRLPAMRERLYGDPELG
jgi:hypothetical protein